MSEGAIHFFYVLRFLKICVVLDRRNSFWWAWLEATWSRWKEVAPRVL